MIALRRAGAGDVDWLAELYVADDVEPFMGGRHVRDRETLAAEVERSEREPERFGRMVIELEGERAGALGYEQVSAPNRIVRLGGLAVHPDFRGRRLADAAARLVQRYLIEELGYHRLELACFAFNERAIAHAERSGFVREGVKRRAYLRHGEWQDAVQFALLADEL
ncbi:MAG TPA: GNAT family protein [Gaiellaceae bacterium]|nr:GNAT family protein [Gaiellaceae bacterium]